MFVSSILPEETKVSGGKKSVLHVFLIHQRHVSLFLVPAVSSAPLLKFSSPTASAAPLTPSAGSPEDHETTPTEKGGRQ